jgi:hypothetical protein
MQWNRHADATLVLKMRMPFDILAQRFISKASRMDTTAIELFSAGMRDRDAGIRRQFSGGT